MIEAGVPKENLALLAIPMVPIQILLPVYISRYTAGTIYIFSSGALNSGPHTAMSCKLDKTIEEERCHVLNFVAGSQTPSSYLKHSLPCYQIYKNVHVNLTCYFFGKNEKVGWMHAYLYMYSSCIGKGNCFDVNIGELGMDEKTRCVKLAVIKFLVR